jgi:hypothetical protein
MAFPTALEQDFRPYPIIMNWSDIHRALQYWAERSAARLDEDLRLWRAFLLPLSRRSLLLLRSLSRIPLEIVTSVQGKSIRSFKAPLIVVSGFLLLASLVLVSVVLIPVIPFQESEMFRRSQTYSPSTFEQKMIADSLLRLAGQRLTVQGRQSFAKDLTARLARNLAPVEADHYVRGRSLLLQSLTQQLEADVAHFEQAFSRGQCGAEAELQFAATIWELATFRDSHFHGVINLNTTSPVAEVLVKDYADSGQRVNQLQLSTLLRVADGALKAKCFDLAHEMYKKVVPVASTVGDMQRARAGIETAQRLRFERR